MALLTFMLALWLLVFRREWKHGLGLAFVSLAWWAVATQRQARWLGSLDGLSVVAETCAEPSFGR